MNILITGGLGMIGTELSKQLMEKKYSIHIVDNFFRGNNRNLKEIERFSQLYGVGFNFYELDLLTQTLDHIGPDIDCVIHLADVVGGINYVFNNQFELLSRNLIIDSNVTRYIRRHGISRSIYVGTACSFPRGKQLGSSSVLFEKDKYPAEPESTYGWSKLVGEMLFENLNKDFGLDTCTVILHNVYGKYCDFSEAGSQAIPALIRKAVAQPDSGVLSVWGNGAQSRSFINSVDVAKFIVQIISSNRPVMDFDKCQIGGDTAVKISRVAEIVRDQVKHKGLTISYDTSMPSGDIGRAPDLTKSKELGFLASISLEHGIKDLIDWYTNEFLN